MTRVSGQILVPMAGDLPDDASPLWVVTRNVAL
jgi:hypothetical protein